MIGKREVYLYKKIGKCEDNMREVTTKLEASKFTKNFSKWKLKKQIIGLETSE